MRSSPETIAAQADELRAALADGPPVELRAGLDMPVLLAARADLLALLRLLRDRHGFAHLSLVTAVDHLPQEPRFEVVYLLNNVRDNRWLRVKTRCPEEHPTVPSATGLWPGANWHERECHDMFGILFEGHPDLRRILMPEGYPHHPLRKDFPRDGIEPDRLFREWDAARRGQGGA